MSELANILNNTAGIVDSPNKYAGVEGQYAWDLGEKNKQDSLETASVSDTPIMRYQMRGQNGNENSVIQDIIDTTTNKKVGAYNTQTGYKYGMIDPSKKPGYYGTKNAIDNAQNIVNNPPSYILPEDVAKMNPSDNSSGKMIGSKIGAIVGAPLGFLAGGAAGSVGGPIGSVVGAGLGTAGGLAGGHQVGSRIGGDLDYFWKGINETMQENLPNAIQSEKNRRLNQESVGGMGTRLSDSVK